MDLILILYLLFLSSIILYLIVDFRGPGSIPLRPGIAFGTSCYHAKDLIIQECEGSDNLWATRGMAVYCLNRNEGKFTRITHIPSGFSFFWLNNFKIIRVLTVNPECAEISVNRDGSICAFSAGFIWYRDSDGKRFRKTFRLSHYGIGRGRGIFNGLLKVNNNLLFFGEYFRNKEKTQVRIYKSSNFGQTWEIAHEFKPGTIYHIHALQKDPYTGRLWICTGDDADESMIGWSDDDFQHIYPIGHGSLIWVACKLVFTEEDVYWGTDADSSDVSGIYKWNKSDVKLTRIIEADGAFFYGTMLKRGTIVMSTDRESLSIEKDDKTRLYIIDKNNNVKIITCGTWNNKKAGFQFRFAKLRFQRYQGNDSLWITCLNQKEIPDGDMIMVSEESLNSGGRIGYLD